MASTSTSIANTAGVDDAFQRAVELRLQSLNAYELAHFRSAAGPEAILKYANEHDHQHAGKSKSRRCAVRLKPLLSGVSQYVKFVGIITQYNPDPSSLIWGSIFCVLQLATNYAAYYGKVMDILEEVGVAMRFLPRYSTDLYADSSSIQDLLVELYGNIIDLSRVAVSVFVNERGQLKSGLRTFGRLTWQPFEERFERDLKAFRKNLDILEQEMRHADRATNKIAVRRTDEAQQKIAAGIDDLRITSTRAEQSRNADQARTDIQQKKMIAGIDKLHSDSKRVHGMIDAETRMALLQWLSSLSFREQHHQSRDLRNLKTGQWLLDCEEYQSWCRGSASPMLKCVGHVPPIRYDYDLLISSVSAGTGKTILAAMVIEDLLEAYSDAAACVAYVYCDSRNQTTTDPRELKSSLLKQICATRKNIPEEVVAKYNTMRRTDAGRLTEPEIDELLTISVQGFSSIAIVVDALDECTMPASLCTTLSNLSSLQAPPPIKVFLTTRPGLRDVDDRLIKSPIVSADSRRTQKDIETYVTDSVLKLIDQRRLISHNPELTAKIIATLVEKADSMFLWAQLQLETLCEQTNEAEIREALDGLPYGLDKVYDRALEAIDTLKPSRKRLAHKILAWVIHSKRSLTLKEMAEAVAVEPGSKSLDPSRVSLDSSQVIGCCCGLVKVDTDNRIQTVHSSVDEYFNKLMDEGGNTSQIRFALSEAEEDLAITCMSYLYFSPFRTAPTTDEATATLMKEHRLLQYCVEYGDHHIQPVISHRLKDLLLAVGGNEGCRETSRRVWCALMSTDALGDQTDYEPTLPNAVHFLQTLCYTEIFITECNFELDLLVETDGWGRTPLMVAAKHGQVNLAEYLLARSCDATVADKAGCNALWWASDSGSTRMIELLLNAGCAPSGHESDSDVTWQEFQARKLEFRRGWSIDPQEFRGVTSLHKALVEGSRECVQALLKAWDASQDPEIDLWVNPVLLLCDRWTTPLVDVIAQAGFDLDTQYPSFPLPSSRRYLDSFVEEYAEKLRARRKALGDKRNGFGVVDFAILERNTKLLDLLLARGVGISQDQLQCGLDQTVSLGDLPGTKWFLDHGADPNFSFAQHNSSSGEHGTYISPLELSLWSQSTDVLACLIAGGADLGSTQTRGQTILHVVAESGRLDACKVLIDAVAMLDAGDNTGNTPLHMASRSGHSEVIALLISAGAALNATNIHGETPLFLAALHGLGVIAEQLLNAGSDVTMAAVDGATSLHVAAAAGHLQTCETLVASRAPIDAKDSGGCTPLHEAARNGRIKVVELLLGHGADIAVKDNDGLTPLHQSAYENFPMVARLLIVAGAELNTKNKQGDTALIITALTGHLEVCEVLIKAGATINVQSNNNKTALFLAAYEGHLEVCEALLAADAALDIQNQWGETALLSAARTGKLDVCRLLIAAGAAINIVSQSGRTALHGATHAQHPEICRILIAAGAALDVQAQSGDTVLILAAWKGYIDICKLLIGAGAELDIGNQNGTTALHAAANAQQLEFCRILIEAKATVDLKDHNGETALFQAACSGNVDACKLLIEAGAALNILDQYKRTALHEAAYEGHFETCNILVAAGAALDLQDQNGETALIRAVWNGHLDVCKLLIAAGAALDTVDTEGLSALQCAVASNNIEICSSLVAAKAALNDKTQRGNTPLIWAAKNGLLEICNILVAAGAVLDIEDAEGRTALAVAELEGHEDVVKLLRDAENTVPEAATAKDSIVE